MIDYLTDVQPLEATMTDAEIASVLSASTSRDIQIADLENFLDFEGLAARNAITGSWEGPLPDEIASNANGLSAGLSALFNHINKPRSVIVDTTVSPWAEQAFQLTSGLIAAGLITSAQQDSFYDLGGGRPNPSLTSADVATCRSDWVAAEAARQAEQEAEAARQDRSLSWIVQKAWKIARREIMKYPSVNEFPGEEDAKEVENK